MGGMGFGQSHLWRNVIANSGPGFYITVAIILGLVLYGLSRIPGKTTNYGPAPAAWAACASHVEKQHSLPAADAGQYNPASVTLLSADHYQVDLTYAKAKTAYRCELQHASNGDWQLLSLNTR